MGSRGVCHPNSTTMYQFLSLRQVEVFTRSGHYEPAGTLRMTWLDVGAQRGVVGVSLGSSADPAGIDFNNQVCFYLCSRVLKQTFCFAGAMFVLVADLSWEHVSQDAHQVIIRTGILCEICIHG